MRFRLQLYGPLPNMGDVMVVDLNPEVTSLKLTTKRPGGYNTLDVGMQDPDAGPRMWLPRPLDINHFGHVELYAGRHCLFYGQITKRSRTGGEVRGFQATGYGISATSDDFYTSTDSTTLQTSGALLRSILAQCAPILRLPSDAGHFIDPGTSHYPADFNQMAPADVLNQLLREGGGSDNLWDWLVFEGPAGPDTLAPTATFLPRTPPAVADYWIPWEQAVTWDEDGANLYGAIATAYTTSGSGGTAKLTATTQTRSFVDQYGRYRRKLVKASQEPDNAAIQFQETWRVKYSVPDVQAKVVLSGEDLTGPGGAAVPVYLARCDQWMQVGDWGAPGPPVPLPIIETSYDAFSDQMSITLNSYPTGLFDALYQAVAVGSAVTRNVNPITGATRLSS